MPQHSKYINESLDVYEEKKGIRVSEYTQFPWNSIANINFSGKWKLKRKFQIHGRFHTQLKQYVCLLYDVMFKGQESRVKNWHLKCQMWSRENGRNFFSQIVYISARLIQPSYLPTLAHSQKHMHELLRNSYVWMDARPPRNSRFLWFCEFWAQRNWEIWVYAHRTATPTEQTHAFPLSMPMHWCLVKVCALVCVNIFF